MLIRRFYDTRLAQASYLVGCQRTGEALIIDPNRDIAPYRDAVKAEGMRLTHVTETHIHADYLSGSRELRRLPARRCCCRMRAGRTGATDSRPNRARYA